MKKAYKVYWASVAENDLLGIILYIAEDSPSNAQKILSKIQTRTAKLNLTPERGRIVPELLRQGISSYREIVLRPWRVIYKIEGSKVFVISVIDSRRNVEDILLARLLQ